MKEDQVQARQASRRTLNLGVGLLGANFVKRTAHGDSKSSVRTHSACRRRGARAAAVPPISGPRSRAALADCNPHPHQQRCALQPWGATANGACARGHHHRPDASGVVCHAFACHPRARAGGLGHGRRLHSRWPRPAHDLTLSTARRLRPSDSCDSSVILFHLEQPSRIHPAAYVLVHLPRRRWRGFRPGQCAGSTIRSRCSKPL